MTQIKGYKKQTEFLRLNDEKSRDENYVEEFSINSLADIIRINGDNYVSSLKNQLTTRSTLLVGENRKIIQNEIEEILNKIQKVKELLK